MSDTFDSKETCDHCLRPVARFGELAAGELFRFPGSQKIQCKTKHGYHEYVENPRPKWRPTIYGTGARVAVIPVSSEMY